MAQFSRKIGYKDISPKAWEITSSWEGPWSSVAEECNPFPNCEENAYGEWWGTNYGLTGTFMRDFAGWGPDRKLEFQTMSVERCGDVWYHTRWTWLRGDKIVNQEIANLLFDWGVRRWNSLINGVRLILGQGQATATKPQYITVNGKKKKIDIGDSLIGKGDAYTTHIKFIDVGGKPENENAGCFIFTDYAIERLNLLAVNPSTHEKLKKMRYKLDSPIHYDSVKDRYNSFLFRGTPTKFEWEKAKEKKRKKMSGVW